MRIALHQVLDRHPIGQRLPRIVPLLDGARSCRGAAFHDRQGASTRHDPAVARDDQALEPRLARHAGQLPRRLLEAGRSVGAVQGDFHRDRARAVHPAQRDHAAGRIDDAIARTDLRLDLANVTIRIVGVVDAHLPDVGGMLGDQQGARFRLDVAQAQDQRAQGVGERGERPERTLWVRTPGARRALCVRARASCRANGAWRAPRQAPLEIARGRGTRVSGSVAGERRAKAWPSSHPGARSPTHTLRARVPGNTAIG